jgi:hypothetical protein
MTGRFGVFWFEGYVTASFFYGLEFRLDDISCCWSKMFKCLKCSDIPCS